jgi:hypothetical protein
MEPVTYLSGLSMVILGYLWLVAIWLADILGLNHIMQVSIPRPRSIVLVRP